MHYSPFMFYRITFICFLILNPELLSAQDGNSEIKSNSIPEHYFSEKQFQFPVTILSKSDNNKIILFWVLSSIDESTTPVETVSTVKSGKKTIDLKKGQKLGHLIEFEMPSVRRKVRLRIQIGYAVSKSNVDIPITFLDTIITVYPKSKYMAESVFTDKKIAVFGKNNSLTKLLQDLNVKVTTLNDTDQFYDYDGDLIIVTPDKAKRKSSMDGVHRVFQNKEFRKPILIFSENVNISETKMSGYPVPVICSEVHPVFHSINEIELTGWQGNLWKSSAVNPIYETGNFRILVTDQAQESSLLEFWTHSKSHVSYCQIPLLDRLDIEPVAPTLLLNLIRYSIEQTNDFKSNTATFRGDAEDEILTQLIGTLSRDKNEEPVFKINSEKTAWEHYCIIFECYKKRRRFLYENISYFKKMYLIG